MYTIVKCRDPSSRFSGVGLVKQGNNAVGNLTQSTEFKYKNYMSYYMYIFCPGVCRDLR